MPLKFAPAFRACGVVGLLMAGALYAAEPKPSLVGATREQVLARFGEPKSHIVAGNREVLLFTTERVVLRDGRVVEAEEIVPEPAPASASAPSKPAATDATAAADSTSSPGTPAVTPPPTNSRTATVAARGSGEPAAATGAAGGTETTSSTSVAPAEPQAIIKSVRPPSRISVSPSVPSSAAVVPPEPAPAIKPAGSATSPGPSDVAQSSSSPVERANPPAAGPGQPPVAPEPQVLPSTATPTPPPAAPEAGLDQASAAAPAPPAIAPAEMAKAAAGPSAPKVVRRVSAPAAPEETSVAEVTTSVFTARTYLFALVIIVGGIGYLIWRRRQRQLMLDVTAVSRSPFAPEAIVPANAGTRFTAELLGKLEWKRFEELVAAYYNKTGVVAARTKAGPASAVHIKISWKGEQRPFACVHCLCRPTALIDTAPILALCESIAGEDIRRGYVVTTGKFSVSARDLAEEKHITLLSGDIFLEKLNALPDAARTELMKDATNGDYMTPTCPRCDVKMVRAVADPSVWQCPQCGEVLPRLS